MRLGLHEKPLYWAIQWRVRERERELFCPIGLSQLCILKINGKYTHDYIMRLCGHYNKTPRGKIFFMLIFFLIPHFFPLSIFSLSPHKQVDKPEAIRKLLRKYTKKSFTIIDCNTDPLQGSTDPEEWTSSSQLHGQKWDTRTKN